MLFVLIIYFIGEIIEDLLKPKVKIAKAKANNYSLNVSKAGFVNSVVDWCKENMAFPKHHKYYPTVEIKYYINKNANGDYCSSTRKIRIFINNHNSIEDLVNTIIHEYTHYLQMPKEKHQTEYTKLNNSKM